VISALSLLGGVLAGLLSAAGPHAYWSAMALMACTLVLLTRLRHHAWVRSLAMAIFGMALAALSVARWQELRLAPVSADTRVLLEGMIRGVPAQEGAEWRFDAEVTLVGAPADPRRRRARLTWRNAPVAPRAGERWRWVVRLSPAAELHNFAGIDAGRIAMRDRVHITGRILPAALNTRLALARTSVDTLRARITARISDSVADPNAAALITALDVGITSAMSTDQWRVFNATATTHLVAISGLHVTLFALLAFGAARVAWRWLPVARLIEREPFAILLGLCAAGGYSLLAGFSVPTQRTWLMLAIFAIARLAARQVGAARPWSLALVVVLLIDVFAPLAAGFWLSFVAVGVLLLMDSSSLVRETRLRAWWRLQLAVTLALAPLTFAVFGGVSVVGVAVNVVAIPVVSLLFVPLVLAGALAALMIPALSPWIFSLAAGLHDGLWPLLVWAADFDLAQWRADPPAWWFALALPAALLSLLRWPLPLRLTAAGVALPLMFSPSRLPEPGTVRISVLDAGRGAAVLVATHSRLLLFDTGDGWNTHGTRAARVVLPALDALGRRRLDLLVLPVLDADRARGAALLASEGEVGRIIVGGGWPATVLPTAACRDARFEWDGVRFEIFAAGPADRHCLLRVAVGERAVLLGGNLDSAAGALASEVVVLWQPSARGSSPEWIEANAGLAGRVIAAGGMPGSETRARVLARWRRAGVAVFDTSRDGAIDFSFGTQGVFAFATARSTRYPFAWRRFK
jgi:competence protein ComEC